MWSAETTATRRLDRDDVSRLERATTFGRERLAVEKIPA